MRKITKTWLRLKLFYYLFRATKNPYDIDVFFKINPILIELGCMKQAMLTVEAFPGELNDQNYLLSPINLQELKTRPPGSVGRVYADHMLSLGLSPEAFEKLEVTDDRTRFLLRSRQVHDLWHVFTGFSTSIEDELALQAFFFAQIRYPLSPFLIGAGILKLALTNHPLSSVVFDRVSIGWRLGLATQNIFGIDWQAHWSTPLEELRARYGFTPVSTSKVDFRNPSGDPIHSAYISEHLNSRIQPETSEFLSQRH